MRTVTLITTMACLAVGMHLLSIGQETTGMMFVLASCLGLLSYTTEE